MCLSFTLSPTGTLNQFAIVTGILFANVVGKPFSLESTGFWSWRGLLGIVALIPAILSLLLSPLLLESPRWLMMKDRLQEATETLCRLRGLDKSVEPSCYELDLVALKQSKGNTDSSNESACYLLLGKYRFPLFIAVFLQVAQQLSGINAVFYYSTSFFQTAHVNDPWLGTVLVSAVNVLATGVAVLLMDRMGRRQLLLASSFGMLISCLSITVVLYFIALNPSQFLGSMLVGFLLVYVSAFEIGEFAPSLHCFPSLRPFFLCLFLSRSLFQYLCSLSLSIVFAFLIPVSLVN